jgi:hypothetical protein
MTTAEEMWYRPWRPWTGSRIRVSGSWMGVGHHWSWDQDQDRDQVSQGVRWPLKHIGSSFVVKGKVPLSVDAQVIYVCLWTCDCYWWHHKCKGIVSFVWQHDMRSAKVGLILWRVLSTEVSYGHHMVTRKHSIWIYDAIRHEPGNIQWNGIWEWVTMAIGNKW